MNVNPPPIPLLSPQLFSSCHCSPARLKSGQLLCIINSRPSSTTTLVCTTFLPPSSDIEAEVRLHHLRQYNQPVHKYAVVFHTLAVQFSWGDSALCTSFLEGLEHYICDEMVGRELPKTLNAAIQLALDIDLRVLSRTSPPRRSHPATSAPLSLAG